MREDELDRMLALMCDAFDLPFGAAQGLFRGDPYFDLSRKRVLVQRGEILSCLTIVEVPTRIGDAVVPVAGIAGVATRAGVRRRGHAERLLVSTLPVLREQGFALSALFAEQPAYYRRLGWEVGGVQLCLRFEARDLPRFVEARQVRSARAEDVGAVAALYAVHAANRTGSRVRDERRWRYIVQQASSLLVYEEQSGLQGYALTSVRQGECGPEVHVTELVPESDAALRGLVGHLAANAGAPRLVYVAPVGDAVAGQVLAWAVPADVGIYPGALYRIVDFGQAVKALAPNLAAVDREVALVAEGTDDAAGRRRAIIRPGGSEPATDRDPDAADHPDRVVGGAHAWAQVLVGHLSFEDAAALGRLRATSLRAAEAATQVFPRRYPFVPVPDHF